MVASVAVDEDLIEASRHGAAGAFRALFERHAGGVRRFLRDLLGDAAAADEATQETFVRAHAALRAAPAAVQRVAPWLFGIARNVAHEQRRARARTVPVADPVRDDAPDQGFDPEALLLDREADAMLAWALERLPEERRAAVLLRTDHGLSYEDIAAAMGWNVAKVKNEVHRARAQLRASLVSYLSNAEGRGDGRV